MLFGDLLKLRIHFLSTILFALIENDNLKALLEGQVTSGHTI
jgi:hypothetical protein